MYSQAALIERIDYLKSISPSGAASLFSELITAMNDYFTRDAEFEDLIRKTLLRVVSDAYSRGIEVDYPERLPPLSTDFPAGYNNIAEIFGREVFNEIMTISENAFVGAFVTISQGSNNTSISYSNPIISRWQSEIAASKGAETQLIETLGEFCIRCNEERGLALIFGELGQINQRWSKEQRIFAHHCYISRGFDDVIRMFNLNVFEPHYIAETRGR